MPDTYDRHPLPAAQQACGMVADQVDCEPPEARVRMTVLATEVDFTIAELARAVLGSIRLGDSWPV